MEQGKFRIPEKQGWESMWEGTCNYRNMYITLIKFTDQ